MQVSERNIHDPVPKNVSKFPIHQTYLTSDAEGNNKGVYKFKCPEVWSSARSGKKAIAIRSIRWQAKSLSLSFQISIECKKNINGTITDQTIVLKYANIIAARTVLTDICNDIKGNLELKALNKNADLTFHFWYDNVRFKFLMFISDNNTNNNANCSFRIYDSYDNSKPSASFNILLNQPKDYHPEAATVYTVDNVWDRVTALHFHSSFVPFDNYQYLGCLFDNWFKPIVYQDANASPLFNVWVTTDMKTNINFLYEEFIFRFTFIISSNDQYCA